DTAECPPSRQCPPPAPRVPREPSGPARRSSSPSHCSLSRRRRPPLRAPRRVQARSHPAARPDRGNLAPQRGHSLGSWSTWWSVVTLPVTRRLRDGKSPLHPGVLVAGLVADDPVAARRKVVDRQDAGITGLHQLATSHLLAVRSDHDQVVGDRARVDQIERDFARRGVDRRRVELELGHVDLDGPGRLPSAAPTAGCGSAEGQDNDGGEQDGASHHTAVTARYRIPNRNTQTTSTKCQYRVAPAKPTWRRA